MRDDESTHDQYFGDRPVPDQRDRDVTRAKIEDALFATGERVSIGRFQLLQRVGSGGMGVVWGAWDPELERRVAIKLVKVASSATRESILREGQALAKLSHPNVVPVYDVGSVDDEVYLVMEWIAGDTLRRWATTPHSTSAVVDVYRAVGEGLVAAHTAGIVHRDFKPDNVIVGSDGRARVLDFGLARVQATGDGQVSGTPRYMAPEQSGGAPATAAADQFSFCVSLKETLDRELPSWLGAICARGTAPDPVARFPDMTALLAALARDPARVWRRRAMATGAVVLAAGAFAVGTLDRHPAPCATDSEELAGVWNPAIAKQLAEHARALGPYGVLEAPLLDEHLSRISQRWISARKSACIAHQHDELPAPVYTRTLACLERARGALDATVGAVTRAPLDHFADAVLAVESLPDAEHCALVAATDDLVAPDVPVISALGADATRAQYLALASDPDALPLARSVVAAATALGYQPLIAHAELALGTALADREQASEAIAAFDAAGRAALPAGDDVAFVEAFARELFVAGLYDDPHRSALVSALPIAVMIGERTRARGSFVRALLYNNAGTERLSAGDPAAAKNWLLEARAESEPEDRGAELWSIPGNLAMTVSDPKQRADLFAEARTRLERLLGPQHAFTLQERLREVHFIADVTVAATQLREICGAFLHYHPDRTGEIGECNYELGWLAFRRGDADEARRAMTIVARSNVDQAERAKATLAFLDGDLGAAAQQGEAIARASAHAVAWWERFPAVDGWILAATADRALGRTAAASAALREASAIIALPGFTDAAQWRAARIRELVVVPAP